MFWVDTVTASLKMCYLCEMLYQHISQARMKLTDVLAQSCSLDTPGSAPPEQAHVDVKELFKGFSMFILQFNSNCVKYIYTTYKPDWCWSF